MCIDGPLKGQTVSVAAMRDGSVPDLIAPVWPDFRLFVTEPAPMSTTDTVTYKWEDWTEVRELTYEGVTTTVSVDVKVWRCGRDFR